MSKVPESSKPESPKPKATIVKDTPSEKPRKFYTANPTINASLYQSNYISTTRYSALTFLPLSLMGQFKRYANIYFLLMAIIQCFPQISPINPVSSIAPLIFVISLSILREGFEDLTRHKSDLELNASKTARYSQGEWEICDWKDVLVGDFIKVKNGEFFPSDMICIRTSDSEGNCLIQTSSLDGEKNLKPRMAITETQAEIENPKILRVIGEFEMDTPNSDLYSCNGTVSWAGDKKLALSVKNLLLRGSVLKNTDWVIGVTVYTGKDTKIMKNAEDSKFKQSQIEVRTNRLIIVILIFQIVVCLISAILNIAWNSQNLRHYKLFVPESQTVFVEGIFLFLTMMILTGTMIPISLIVSLEMVKLVQAYFINNDQDMYFAENNRFCKVFTSSLNEELGQIEFIFSDKTGTLTANKMEFKYCVIGNILYGQKEEKVQERAEDDGFPAEPQKKKPLAEGHVSYNFKDERLDNLHRGTMSENPQVNLSLYHHTDPQSTKPLYTFKTQMDLAREFLFLLSVCHDCVLDTNEEGVSTYQGQSPDEITLVDAAKRLGFEFIGANSTTKNIKIFGTPTRIKVLKYFEFNSDRKRASVITKDKETGVIKLLIKGADSVIMERLEKSRNQENIGVINKQLEKFSNSGLRTLCMAERILTEEEYTELDAKMLEAASKTDREKIIGSLSSRRQARRRAREEPHSARMHCSGRQAPRRSSGNHQRHAQGR